jgi:predicted AAA+ superfamily ATPase
MYISRTIEKKVKELTKEFKVLVVTGARQVGKSTMLKHCDHKRTYVSLGKPNIREFANSEPELFLQRYKSPVIIDEIQYAPILLDYIKEIVDNSEKRGQYWLTGSQPFHLMKNVSETLAGRAAIINMLGLSINEKQNATDIPIVFNTDYLNNKRQISKKLSLQKVFEYIYKGSYPELYAGNISDLDVYYNSYLQTYIERDIRALTTIEDENSFIKFMRIVAARTGQVVKYNQLALEAGISQPTAKKWLSLLITSGIVYLLEPFYENLTKRLTKMPKLYFYDTGLCAFLCGWSSPKVLEQGAMNGAFFENFVVIEILKNYLNNGKKPSFFFYRDTEQKEIDLIIEQNQKLFPIEIKLTASPNKTMVKNFSILPEEKFTSGALICMTSEDYPITSKVNAVPIWYL